jgi:RES domain-containing protein
MQLWRLCKDRYREAAFTGEGARLYAGRWNPAGVRMVYTSSSLALAAVELFVHLDPRDAPDDLVVVSALLDPGQVSVERMDPAQLPPDWRAMEHAGLRAIGAEWVPANRFAALEVPSLAVEGEWNVLLNPAHADCSKIILLEPKPFHFDERMFQARFQERSTATSPTVDHPGPLGCN